MLGKYRKCEVRKGNTDAQRRKLWREGSNWISSIYFHFLIHRWLLQSRRLLCHFNDDKGGNAQWVNIFKFCAFFSLVQNNIIVYPHILRHIRHIDQHSRSLIQCPTRLINILSIDLVYFTEVENFVKSSHKVNFPFKVHLSLALF